MSKKDEYKQYLGDYLQTKHGINNLRRNFRCLNPNHEDNNPSMSYHSGNYYCKCFSCGAKYDIYDLVGMDYHIDNFKDQIRKVEEIYLGYVPEEKEFEEIDNSNFDYSNYYNQCIKDVSKTEYLQNRGITDNLIEKYKIGFDEKRNLMIFPINIHCYFARSVENNTKRKSKGKSDIWNKELLLNSNKTDLIFVTEGIIDSLSLEVIDPNIKTISINGVGNIKSLIYAIKEFDFKGIIIPAFDNDYAGEKATKELTEQLEDMNVKVLPTALINNFDEGVDDINKALLYDKVKLKNNYLYCDKFYKKYLEKMIEGDSIEY